MTERKGISKCTNQKLLNYLKHLYLTCLATRKLEINQKSDNTNVILKNENFNNVWFCMLKGHMFNFYQSSSSQSVLRVRLDVA